MCTPTAYLLRINKHDIFDGNKAKGRISKRVFQENKARKIYQKTNISYPLIRPLCLITDIFSVSIWVKNQFI